MPREVTLPPNPQELRCPNPHCGVVVGHTVTAQEAPLCSDCRRLAPLEARLTAIEDALSRLGQKAETLDERTQGLIRYGAVSTSAARKPL
jgi:hypothetical protein